MKHEHEYVFVGTRTIGDFGVTQTRKFEIWQCDECKHEKTIRVSAKVEAK